MIPPSGDAWVGNPQAPRPHPTPAAVPPSPGRRWSLEELQRLGEEGLRQHVVDRAQRARAKYGHLTPANLDRFLLDPECLRRPARVVFALGEMGRHQFAHPLPDAEDPSQSGVVLFVHPSLQPQPDLLPLAAAYFVPVINYGDAATDTHCLLYGASLFGMTEEAFYDRICAAADAAGAEQRYLPC